MTQSIIASTACVYTQNKTASTAYGHPQTVFYKIPMRKFYKIANRGKIPCPLNYNKIAKAAIKRCIK